MTTATKTKSSKTIAKPGDEIVLLEKPTRPKNKYWLWLSDVRSEIRADLEQLNPHKKVTGSEVNQQGAIVWRGMNDDDKAPWTIRYTELKKEYNAKLDAYDKQQRQLNKADDKPVKRKQVVELDSDDVSSVEEEDREKYTHLYE